jgi:hypothetical protein
MGPQKFCQSCTLPIDSLADRGTEKDGTKSDLYCKYCYANGAFTDPDMTLERMKEIAKAEMKKQNLPQPIIQKSLEMLPGLKRWKAPQLESGTVDANHLLM